MIGRKSEQGALARMYESDESEFVAIYGRRRVGKTYLVRETFDGQFTFQHSGLASIIDARKIQCDGGLIQQEKKILKNIQIKIVMIFAILGIIVISGLGIFSLYNFQIRY